MGSTPAPSQCLEQHYWNRDRSKNETRLKCQSLKLSKVPVQACVPSST